MHRVYRAGGISGQFGMKSLTKNASSRRILESFFEVYQRRKWWEKMGANIACQYPDCGLQD